MHYIAIDRYQGQSFCDLHIGIKDGDTIQLIDSIQGISSITELLNTVDALRVDYPVRHITETLFDADGRDGVIVNDHPFIQI